MSVYKVAAAIELKSNVAAVLSNLTKELMGFDKALTTATTNVDKLGTALRKLTRTEKAASALVGTMEKLKTAIAGDKMATHFEQATTAMRGVVSQSERLTTVLRENSKLSANLVKNTTTAGKPATPTTRQAASHSGSHGDGYFAAAQAAAVGSSVVALDVRAIRESMLVDSRAAVIGLNSGWSPKQIEEARKRAAEISREVPGTTQESNLESIREGFGQLGDIDEALKSLKPMAQMSRVFAMMDRGHGGDGNNKTAVLNAYRFIEDTGLAKDKVTGHITADAMADAARMIERIYAGTQGRVGPDQLFAFIKQARGAGISLSREGLEHYAPIMNALGASRSGTALSSAFQQFQIGTMTEDRFRDAKKAGIYDQSAVWHKGRVRDADRHLTDRDLGTTDPIAWINKVIEPGLKKLGYLTTGPDGAIGAGRIASRSTTWGLLVEGLIAKSQIEKQYANIQKTVGDPYQHLMRTDPFVKVDELKSAENDLMVTLGSFLQGPAITLLKQLTGVLQGVSDWAKTNPETAKNAAEFLSATALITAGLGILYASILPWKMLFGGGKGGAPAVVPPGGAPGAPVAAAAGFFETIWKGLAGSGLGVGFLFDHQDQVKKLMHDSPAARARIQREQPMDYLDGLRAKAWEGTPAAATGGPTLANATRDLVLTVTGLKNLPLPPPVEQTIQVRGDVSLYGDKVGEIMMDHIARRIDRPGAGGFDPRNGPLHPLTPW